MVYTRSKIFLIFLAFSVDNPDDKVYIKSVEWMTRRPTRQRQSERPRWWGDEGTTMDKISAIRCVVNPASVTEADVEDCLPEIVDEADGAVLSADDVCDMLDLPRGHESVSRKVMGLLRDLT